MTRCPSFIGLVGALTRTSGSSLPTRTRSRRTLKTSKKSSLLLASRRHRMQCTRLTLSNTTMFGFTSVFRHSHLRPRPLFRQPHLRPRPLPDTDSQPAVLSRVKKRLIHGADPSLIICHPTGSRPRCLGGGAVLIASATEMMSGNKNLGWDTNVEICLVQGGRAQ